MMRLSALTSTLAGVSGFGASIVAQIPADPGSLEAIGKWPLTVVLGAVCVVSIYFSYRQGKESRSDIVKMAEGERLANAQRVENYSKVTSALADRHAESLKQLAEAHNKEVITLLEKIVRKD